MLSKRHQPRSAQLKTQDVSIFMSHSRNQDHEKETLGDVGRNGGDCHLSCLAVSLALWDTKVIIPQEDTLSVEISRSRQPEPAEPQLDDCGEADSASSGDQIHEGFL